VATPMRSVTPRSNPVARVLRRPVVLVYHGVGDVTDAQDPRRLIVSPAHLEAHIRLLQRRGYAFVRACDLLDAGVETSPRAGTAVLTFDDGWLDGLTVVAPLLHRLGVPATFYVCPGMWGAQHPNVAGHAGRLLDREQARTLQALGMELGSHTMTHPDLRGLGDHELADELERSKSDIEALTGHACRTLAYPFGLFDGRVERAVAAAGYELAFAWQPRPWRALAAPRLPGPPRHGARRLVLKLVGIRRHEP
jgi:peptidoglycan/xylan/chitin deacetylase (PgdA/CDA1 family)